MSTFGADSREFARVQRLVLRQKPEGIAIAAGWSAAELDRKLRARSKYLNRRTAVLVLIWISLLVLPHWFPDFRWAIYLLGCFVGAMTGTYLLVRPDLRSSPLIGLMGDPNWINFLACGKGGLDEPTIRRLLAESEGEFSLTREAEKGLRRRLTGFASGEQEMRLFQQSEGPLAAELLARFGTDRRSGEMLGRLVKAASYPRPAANLFERLQALHSQFKTRVAAA